MSGQSAEKDAGLTDWSNAMRWQCQQCAETFATWVRCGDGIAACDQCRDEITRRVSLSEVERALAEAGLQEGAEDDPYWTGRMEAVEIVRDMLGLGGSDV